MPAQPGDRVGDGLVQQPGEADQLGEGFDVAGGDPAGVGADDAPNEGGVVVVLDDVTAARLGRPAVSGRDGECHDTVDRGQAHRAPPVVWARS